jgi:cytidylate kinase
MIIAVSGFTGSGKNTLGSLIAEELSYQNVSPTFKDLADKEGVSLMEFQKMAEKDHEIDKKFDDLLREEASSGDCVVTTWLGPWIVNADLRIRLFADPKIRASRISGRDEMGLEAAEEHVLERDQRNIDRYLDVYGIDIRDDAIFDICLNSGVFKPDQLLSISLFALEKKK